MRRDMGEGAFQEYVSGWKRRLEAREAARRERTRVAWAEARRLASILKRDFGATEVQVFGSLALDAKGVKRFREDSDIDLAVRGVRPDQFFQATGRLLSESAFSVDLVDMDDCAPEWRARIAREGVTLDA
ncbi:nucleotidyltransferase family protein [Limnochorda pilosa]|uniref:Polymerase nucleotidyl transferase domain-containing protein n=1 Tax=Limnochorda pilosa TaxID=1555112 RepID=A0A0K2SJ76_LIMPI|nr:nucleotidyltransferase domain-containing protein [Limnochorda pilosa]BAS26899.1 hypothetical protein LIP_1042 [Limnochorda pilosa]